MVGSCWKSTWGVGWQNIKQQQQQLATTPEAEKTKGGGAGSPGAGAAYWELEPWRGGSCTRDATKVGGLLEEIPRLLPPLVFLQHLSWGKCSQSQLSEDSWGVSFALPDIE